MLIGYQQVMQHAFAVFRSCGYWGQTDHFSKFTQVSGSLEAAKMSSLQISCWITSPILDWKQDGRRKGRKSHRKGGEEGDGLGPQVQEGALTEMFAHSAVRYLITAFVNHQLVRQLNNRWLRELKFCGFNHFSTAPRWLLTRISTHVACYISRNMPFSLLKIPPTLYTALMAANVSIKLNFACLMVDIS